MFLAAATVATLAVVLGWVWASPAWATTITVNSLADDTDPTDAECTLREAIGAANANTASGAALGECAAGEGTVKDVIDIGVTGTVQLTGALPDLASNMDIEGPGADQFTVRRNTGGDYGILRVTSGSEVSVSGITITNGNAGGGGGIQNGGNLTITNSTISGNSASSLGGGIVSHPGPLTISNSTISGNSAGEGGAIWSNASFQKTTITNTTISDNSADFISGGVHNENGLIVIEHSTITNNTAPNGKGSGVGSFGDARTRTEVLSSIISANTNTDVDIIAGPNTYDSSGYNLIGDGNATSAFNQTGDQTSVTDPKLRELGNYGGPTKTHALLEGSPAIDQGNSFGLTTDQRGEQRPSDFVGIADASGGDGSDIGAFEVQAPPNQPPKIVVGAGGQCLSNTSAQGTIRLSVADDGGAANLSLSATSSNTALVPNANITFGGSDQKRTMTVRAVDKKSGTARITLTLSDQGSLRATQIVTVKVGTSKDDTISATTGADMLFGLDANDTLKALEGNDLLCSGNDDDILNGSVGQDTLGGGPDDDRINGGGANDRLFGGFDEDRLSGGGGGDLFSGGAGTDTATDFNSGEGDTKVGIP